MRNKGFQAFIFVAIAVVVSAIASLVYILNINTLVNSKARDNIYNNTSSTVSYLNQFVDSSYQDLESSINASPATDGKDKVDAIANIESTKYLGYGYYEYDETTKKNVLKYHTGTYDEFYFPMTREDRILNQKVSITKLSYLFEGVATENDEIVILYNVNNKYIAYQSFELYANLLASPYEDAKDYYVVVSDDAMIYVNTFNTSVSLSGLFGGNHQDTSDFVDELFGNKKVYSKTISGNNYLITYVKALEKYNNEELYIIYFVHDTYLSAFAKTILNSTLVYIAFFIFSMVVLSLFLFLGYSRFKKAKTGFAILPYSYDTHYVLLVNSDGRIITRNKKFAESDFDCKSLLDHEVLELAGNSFGIKELLENGAELTLQIQPEEFSKKTKKNAEKPDEPKYIKFYIIKCQNNYQLIGLDSDSKPYIPTSAGAQKSVDGKMVIGTGFAFTDDTYGIKNRKALNARLDEIILEKAKKSQDLYLFYCGIRSRNEIIKMYGNQINEEVNLKFIEAIKSKIPENVDLYIVDNRYLVFFMRMKDNYVSISTFMEGMAKMFKAPLRVYSNEMNLDVYFGVYPFSIFKFDVSINPKKILEKVTFAYQKATTLKDKNYFLYDGASEDILIREEQTLIDLTAAINKNELKTVFQPVYSLSQDRVSGFECLLRWTNDKYKNESIFDYIRIAEQTGLIHEIGFMTFRQAFQLIRELGVDKDLRISVNVSPAQFSQAGFANRLIEMFAEYNVPYSCIAIEITESFFIDSMGDIIEKLQYIRSFGVKVYLDDFGTGYSSLMYLAELPVDIIKIDRGFTSQIQTNKDVRAILTHILAIARELNIDIVAEGVENEKELSFYEKHDCEYIQGYYFSKPVPKEQAVDTLRIKRVKEESDK